MEIVRVPIADLVLDPRNARRGNVQAIADSLREFGQHRAAIVQRGTNRILVGNHMVKGAMSLGWTEIDVCYVDDDDEKAIRRAIADNATGDQASWDTQQLALLLEEVGPDVPGIDQSMADRLNKLLHPEQKQDPVYPINAQPGERYDYVVVFAETVIDAAWLDNFVGGLTRVKSYKSSSVGRSKVISVQTLRELLDDYAKVADVTQED